MKWKINSLKYIDSKVTFSEVPDEVTLCISISGCQIHCKDCHSKYLWENKGIDLTIEELDRLILYNSGITCICILGGNQDYEWLNKIFTHIMVKYPNIKRAWYSGEDLITSINKTSLLVLDYIKVGSYINSMGGLNNINTNQRFYKIDMVRTENMNKNEIVLTDLTYKFNKLNQLNENEN